MGVLKSGFVHTVYFWLKEKDNQEHINKLNEGLKKLSEIAEIREAYIGKPADTNREVIDSSYSLSITFVFENKEDQDIYQDHPDHHIFIKNCSELWSSVKVYDAC
jgi:hypothetical protein